MKEAQHQQACALTGASPPVLGVSLDEKYIVMHQLVSLPVDTYREAVLPDDLQYMICALMVRMDVYPSWRYECAKCDVGLEWSSIHD